MRFDNKAVKQIYPSLQNIEMKNFIKADIESEAEESQMVSFKKVYNIKKKSNVKKWLWGVFLVMLLALFLPWTQNIRARGLITTLRQEQRPQEINTIIGGRVAKWYIKE